MANIPHGGWRPFCLSSGLRLPDEWQGCNCQESSVQLCLGGSLTSAPPQPQPLGWIQTVALQPGGSVTATSKISSASLQDTLSSTWNQSAGTQVVGWALREGTSGSPMRVPRVQPTHPPEANLLRGSMLYPSMLLLKNYPKEMI